MMVSLLRRNGRRYFLCFGKALASEKTKTAFPLSPCTRLQWMRTVRNPIYVVVYTRVESGQPEVNVK